MISQTANSIVVVDDDVATCRAIAQVLRTHGYRVETFTSGVEYLNSNTHRPDCVLADVRMPELDGVSMFEATRASGRDAPTVFMTGLVDMSTAVAAMRAGASDVLQKPVTIPALLAAVEAATSRSAARREANDAIVRDWRAIGTLTPREAEVCAHVARGLLNKQIAASIGTTEKTVKVHRARALKKLGAHSVAELVHKLDAVLGGNLPSHPLDEHDRPEPRPPALDVIARIFLDSETSPG